MSVLQFIHSLHVVYVAVMLYVRSHAAHTRPINVIRALVPSSLHPNPRVCTLPSPQTGKLKLNTCDRNLSWSRWQSANRILLQWFLDAHATPSTPPTLRILRLQGTVGGGVWPRAAPRSWGGGRESERRPAGDQGWVDRAAAKVPAAATAAPWRGRDGTTAAAAARWETTGTRKESLHY